jgi:hypothetical protein
MLLPVSTLDVFFCVRETRVPDVQRRMDGAGHGVRAQLVAG